MRPLWHGPRRLARSGDRFGDGQCRLKERLQLGDDALFCLDTRHSHVYGFDLATVAGFEKLLITARETIGLENVPVIHSNDAKAVCGSHTDRHANIGTGYIGLEGFRRILNHPDLRAKAFILETPDEEAGGGHLRDIATLKELVSPKKSSTPKKSSPVGTNAGPKTRRSM